MSDKPQPCVKYWDKGISIAVWESKTDDQKIYYSLSVQRTYKKDNAEVTETLHIFPDDLLPLANALTNTYNLLRRYKEAKRQKEKANQTTAAEYEAAKDGSPYAAPSQDGFDPVTGEFNDEIPF